MKLSEFKGEEALDVLADLLEPIVEIMTDEKVIALARKNDKVETVKAAIKNHKKAVIEILATLDRQDPKTYEVNILSLPMKLLELFNDEDLMSLFRLQGQNEEQTFSGSATENTEEGEQ